jgi:hypothetical protein
MSGLSYLWINCLDGAEVEWKTLGDIAAKVSSDGNKTVAEFTTGIPTYSWKLILVISGIQEFT